MTIARAAEPEFRGLGPMVCVPMTATEVQIATAKKLIAAFGVPILEPVKSAGNPTCCVWLEVTHWRPDPMVDGYVINHQVGGTILSASTEGELDKAVTAFIQSAKNIQGTLSAPVGLQTSYPIVPTPK
jgi:hypothetical protein